ncbi:VOC family protein [Sphingomonas sp. RT2P30]|uniref:VOC family protein n=1 Tax=Parasphingomonas halimpatiens TaxID=3096162 RepID=UPI002FC84F61
MSIEPRQPGRLLGFGQRVGGITQMAYVVEDMEAAIAHWVRDTGTGPWFLLESFTGADHVYRGTPSRADVRIAMAFAGHMQIELIQPKDGHPSVYRETIERRGYGFHHVGIACEDVDAETEAYLARGYTLAFTAGVPTGGHVAYLDGGEGHPHFVELIPATSGMDTAFTAFWRASVGWDGRDPIRSFI